MIKKIFLTITLVLSFIFALNFSAFAQETDKQQTKEETLEGVVTNILQKKEIQDETGRRFYQKLEVLVTKGSLKDKKIEVETGNLPLVNQPIYKKEDKLVLFYNKDPSGNDVFYITDFVRRKPLFWLFLLFLFLTIVVAKWKGLSSILGLGFSFLVIFRFILPQILNGRPPVLIAILGSLIIVPISFYFAHGFNKKTSVAIMGTGISLIITGLLANFFVQVAKISGFVSEEAAFLQLAKGGSLNIKGLLLAGIIIGALGILDDITISQAAIVFELKKTSKNLNFKALYKKAMNIGQDHIASMVNTLILVYAGAALPLLLLFVDNPHPFLEIINYEIIAEEIIRTLVASIGLILAVPITTFLAAILEKN